MMDETPWEQKLQALTHILTHPTTTPTLHSQLFISTQIPCYLNWDYPPLLCPKPSTFHLRWTFFLFLKRVSRLGLPLTSWRSRCPYQQPPPLILAKGVDEANWSDEKKREYVRKRLRRKRLGIDVPSWIQVVVPNLLALCLLFIIPDDIS